MARSKAALCKGRAIIIVSALMARRPKFGTSHLVREWWPATHASSAWLLLLWYSKRPGLRVPRPNKPNSHN